MKKNVLKILCVVLTVIMAMSLASCSLFGSKSGNGVTIGGDSAAEAAVAKYVSQNKATLEAQGNESGGGAITCTVEARGTAVVAKYKFVSDIEITAEMKSALEEALSELTSNPSLATEMKKEIPEATAFIFEYYEKNGNLIMSKTLPL